MDITDNKLAAIYDRVYDNYRDEHADMDLQKADDRAHKLALRAVFDAAADS